MSIDLPVEDQLSSTTVVSSPSWWQVWKRAVFRPSVATYEDIVSDSNATFGRALRWIFLSALISNTIRILAVVAILAALTTAPFASWPALVWDLMPGALGGVFLAVLGFVISTGIFHWFAQKLKGTGTYTEVAFAFAAISAPLLFIAFVPCLNSLAIPYGVVLNVIAIKAVHKFGWRNAIVSLFVPGLMIALILIVLELAIGS